MQQQHASAELPRHSPQQVVATQVGFSTPVAQEATAPTLPPTPGPATTVPPGLSIGQVPQPTTTQLSGPAAPIQLSAPSNTELVDAAPPESTGYAGDSRLSISDVIASVYRSFPLIRAAQAQRRLANGELVEAWGAYDTKLQAFTLNEPTGFYRNFRHGIGVARQTWWGGYLSAGWRVGRGDFQPWYKERETNEGGEVKLGFAQPLLQGRAIDPQRVAVFQATLARQAAEPQIQQAILDTAQEAATIYWVWVAAASVLDAQRQMLDLALVRGEELEADFNAQRRAELDLLYNRKLVAARKTELASAQMKFVQSSRKLSLYLRDELGAPIVPGEEWVPKHFPIISPFPTGDFAADLASALERRPEPRLLQLELQKVQLDRRLAINNMMPRIDLVAEASQDVGIPASSKNDKGQLEMMMGIQAEYPLQQRKPQGKNMQALAKIDQISEKLRVTRDKIGVDLGINRRALDLAEQIVRQNREGLALSIEVLGSYQEAYRERVGKTNLIDINLLETEVNQSAVKLIKAQQDWFIALTRMQAILGLNPLDQAISVSQLPESKQFAEQ